MDIITALFFILALVILYRLLDFFYRWPQVDKLHNRYVLVTGCDTGFGYSCVKRLDLLGCRVFAGCLGQAGIGKLKEECSDNVMTLLLDVTKHSDVEKAYEHVTSVLGNDQGLWGMVNNAGISGFSATLDFLTLQDYRDVMDVNFFGMVDVTKTFLPLVKQARGRVVNTASVLGRFNLLGVGPYTSAKHAVIGFSDTIRKEMRPFDVHVSSIEPGFFATDLCQAENMKRNLERGWKQGSPDVKEQYGEDYLQEAQTLTESFVSKVANLEISLVVDAYIDALFCKHPRDQYEVGHDITYMWRPLRLLPTWLSDYIMMDIYPMPKPKNKTENTRV